MDKFLITGTGRCGTTYCRDIFQICGVNCGHQSVFRHDNVLNGQWDWKDYQGDSSFEAVPILDAIKEKEPSTKIILLKRDYEKVALSWIKLGLFKEDFSIKYYMLFEVINKYFPEILLEESPYEKAMKFCEQWMAYGIKYADYVFDIEKLDSYKLFEITGYSHKYDEKLINTISKKINTAFVKSIIKDESNRINCQK